MDPISQSKAINLIELEPGTVVTLANGAVAEVIENPLDGVWLICRYRSHPTQPELVDAAEDQLVFAQDVVRVTTA